MSNRMVDRDFRVIDALATSGVLSGLTRYLNPKGRPEGFEWRRDLEGFAYSHYRSQRLFGWTAKVLIARGDKIEKWAQEIIESKVNEVLERSGLEECEKNRATMLEFQTRDKGPIQEPVA
jgi:hypothetical protein